MPQSYVPFVTLDSRNNPISGRPVSIADGFRLSSVISVGHWTVYHEAVMGDCIILTYSMLQSPS